MTRRATPRGSFRSRRQRLDPRARAVVLIYVGVLLSLVVGTWVLPEDSSDLTDSLVFSAMFVAVVHKYAARSARASRVRPGPWPSSSVRRSGWSLSGSRGGMSTASCGSSESGR